MKAASTAILMLMLTCAVHAGDDVAGTPVLHLGSPVSRIVISTPKDSEMTEQQIVDMLATLDTVDKVTVTVADNAHEAIVHVKPKKKLRKDQAEKVLKPARVTEFEDRELDPTGQLKPRTLTTKQLEKISRADLLVVGRVWIQAVTEAGSAKETTTRLERLTVISVNKATVTCSKVVLDDKWKEGEKSEETFSAVTVEFIGGRYGGKCTDDKLECRLGKLKVEKLDKVSSMNYKSGGQDCTSNNSWQTWRLKESQFVLKQVHSSNSSSAGSYSITSDSTTEVLEIYE